VAQVGRSSFYKWKGQDRKVCLYDENLIEQMFINKKSKAGARKIRMYLQRDCGVVFNLKKIRRIMKLRGLLVKIRKRKQSFFNLRNSVHKVLPNRLNQKFKVAKASKVLSTDITYLLYNNSDKAYLSAVKDLGTKEIVQHSISKNPDVSLVVNGLSDYLKKLPKFKKKRMIIHSDQGVHYTSDSYRWLLKKNGIKQSMSRKGNCLDNAPIESFFGHFKDESEYKNCKSFEELKNEVDKYINYYNNERPQWGLKGKTPVEHRGLIS
jgi:putative transposase